MTDWIELKRVELRELLYAGGGNTNTLYLDVEDDEHVTARGKSPRKATRLAHNGTVVAAEFEDRDGVWEIQVPMGSVVRMMPLVSVFKKELPPKKAPPVKVPPVKVPPPAKRKSWPKKRK